jgi:hypothetical protein
MFVFGSVCSDSLMLWSCDLQSCLLPLLCFGLLGITSSLPPSLLPDADVPQERFMREHLRYDRQEQAAFLAAAQPQLNEDQRNAFQAIMAAVEAARQDPTGSQVRRVGLCVGLQRRRNGWEGCGCRVGLRACRRRANHALLHLQHLQARAFFVDGPGGSGKTFLYTTLLAAVRARGGVALACASSGLATQNMPGGKTAHSTFKIPLQLHDKSVCK